MILNGVNRFKLKDFKSGKWWRLKIKDSFLNRPPISRILNRFKKSFSPHLKSVFCTSELNIELNFEHCPSRLGSLSVLHTSEVDAVLKFYS